MNNVSRKNHVPRARGHMVFSFGTSRKETHVHMGFLATTTLDFGDLPVLHRVKK